MLLAASLSHRWVLVAGIGVERQRLSVMLSVGDATLGNGTAFVTALGGGAALGDDTSRRS